MEGGGVLTEKTCLHLSLWTAGNLVTQREVIQEKEEQVDATGARIQSPLDAVNQITSPFCLKLASGFPLYLE